MTTLALLAVAWAALLLGPAAIRVLSARSRWWSEEVAKWKSGRSDWFMSSMLLAGFILGAAYGVSRTDYRWSGLGGLVNFQKVTEPALFMAVGLGVLARVLTRVRWRTAIPQNKANGGGTG
jgi:hypothetical protein